MLEFTRLKNNLKKVAGNGFADLRLAVLCDYSSQHLCTALQGHGVDKGLAVALYEADYGQIEQQAMDPASALYAFNPQAVLLSKSSYTLLNEFYAWPVTERSRFADEKLTQWQSVLFALQSHSKAAVILTNFLELNDAVYGHYAANVASSFLFQVRKLNLLLMQEAQQRTNLFIADVQWLALECGVKNTVDQKALLAADMPWSLGFLPALARAVIGLAEAINGRFKKCIVLDLDNTLWGGVVGDDGLEGIQLGDFGIGKAFSRLQKWIKELKRRGIIVCVCSKNEEHLAKEVFEKHPDTVLTLDDISVFAANWSNKVDNLHFIRDTLNIGFDSMVFIDDNPFERGMVQEAIPAIEVPELPDDPVDYLTFLQNLNLFETASHTAEDSERTLLYQQETKRAAQKQVYQNESQYLQSLEMVADTKPLDSFTIPRTAQLSQRSNQFNLRTVRYTEAVLQNISVSAVHETIVVSLNDKFGHYGIISAVVLKKSAGEWFIENWMMSCRVLKRGVEEAMLNRIVSMAREAGCQTVVGEYLPTAKNALVKDHYRNLGFRPQGGFWVLSVAAFEERKTFVYFAPQQTEKTVSVQ